MWLFGKKRREIALKKTDLNLGQAIAGIENNQLCTIDCIQRNGIKVLGAMGAGKSTLLETLGESLRRSTPGIRLIYVSVNGQADFLRFQNYDKYEFYNPRKDRVLLYERLVEINRHGEVTLELMERERVRHAKDLKDHEPIALMIDELEMSFPIDKTVGKEEREINEKIIFELNRYLIDGRKLFHIIAVGTQTQTLSASALALRLMHYTFVARLQTKSLAQELEIPPAIALDDSLKAGKFLLLGVDNKIKTVKVARFEEVQP